MTNQRFALSLILRTNSIGNIIQGFQVYDKILKISL